MILYYRNLLSMLPQMESAVCDLSAWICILSAWYRDNVDQQLMILLSDRPGGVVRSLWNSLRRGEDQFRLPWIGFETRG